MTAGKGGPCNFHPRKGRNERKGRREEGRERSGKGKERERRKKRGKGRENYRRWKGGNRMDMLCSFHPRTNRKNHRCKALQKNIQVGRGF